MHSSSGYGNGYHHQHQQTPDKHFGPSLRDRARRGTRRGSGARSRDSREGHGPSGGATVGLRVSEQQRPPTDFDMAYFHSYAHVGIHEEMIKVSFFLSLQVRLIFWYEKRLDFIPCRLPLRNFIVLFGYRSTIVFPILSTGFRQ